MIVFDYTNSGWIHKYLGHKVVKLPRDEFDFSSNIIYFADNSNVSINKAIEKAFKYVNNMLNKNLVVINSPILCRWSYDRDYGFKIMNQIFKDNSNVELLEYKVYKDIDNIDWDKEEGVIKLLYEDAGYKSTYIFHNQEELQTALNNFKREYSKGILIQEFCSGEEIAFGTFFVDSEPTLPVYVSFEFKKSISNTMGGNTGQSAEFGFFSNHDFALSIIYSISEYLKRNNINYTGTIDINGAYKDGKFYPFEWTVSRDGYPEILAWLYSNSLESILQTKQFKNTGYRYIIVIRADTIEHPIKSCEFMINEEEIERNGFIFIPECEKVEDSYICIDPNFLGLLYKESQQLEQIEINPSWFSIPVLFYTSINEDIQRKMEAFKWIES